MTEHTKEPWFFDGDAIYNNADCVGDPIVHVMSCAYDNDLNNIDARRIVAAVNACAGISTKQLENPPNSTRLFASIAFKLTSDNMRLSDDVGKLTAQRDQLKASLDKLVDKAVEIEQQRDQLLAALEVAEQFMVVAGDWNMSEAEINGEMRSTNDLLGISSAAIAAVKGEK